MHGSGRGGVGGQNRLGVRWEKQPPYIIIGVRGFFGSGEIRTGADFGQVLLQNYKLQTYNLLGLFSCSHFDRIIKKNVYQTV